MREDARRIWSLLGPERRRYAIGLTALALVNITATLAPIFLATAIDLTEAALTGATPKTPPVLAMVGVESAALGIGATVALFLLMHAASNVFRYPMLMHTAVPSHQLGQGLRNALASKLLSLSRPFYDRAKSGDLMARATSDINAARMMLGPGILVGADTIMIVVMVLVVMAALSLKMTLITLIPLPIIAWITNRLSHAEYDRFEAVQEDISTLTERTRESYAGIRIIQGYAREGFDRGRFQQRSQEHYRKNIDLARVRSLFDPTLDLMLGASTVLVLIFGGLEVVNDRMTLGTFVAFLFLVGYLSGPMIGFGWSVSLFQRGRASLRRIDALLDEPVEILDPPAPSHPPARGHLELRALTFRYNDDDTPALIDVDVTLPAGATLGVVGPVGSGKSTLARLLVRLYDPPPGTVLLDGEDIRARSLETLRAQVVLAPQDTFLFGDTVTRNILLAVDDDEDPVRHARIAQLHDEIEALSDGYETLLGERGVNLSGGQRQRLAIARAVATDPSVLILDDCLSAVDARTEEAILEQLREVFDGRTGVIISHRVCAVQRCDHIIVLREGRVIERGDHSSLLTAEGYYAEIAHEQSQE